MYPFYVHTTFTFTHMCFIIYCFAHLICTENYFLDICLDLCWQMTCCIIKNVRMYGMASLIVFKLCEKNNLKYSFGKCSLQNQTHKWRTKPQGVHKICKNLLTKLKVLKSFAHLKQLHGESKRIKFSFNT